MSRTNSIAHTLATEVICLIEEIACHSRNNAAAEPNHLLDEARAFVARVQFGRSRSLIDRPYVEKAVIGGAQAGKEFLVGAEGNSSNTECMFI